MHDTVIFTSTHLYPDLLVDLLIDNNPFCNFKRLNLHKSFFERERERYSRKEYEFFKLFSLKLFDAPPIDNFFYHFIFSRKQKGQIFSYLSFQDTLKCNWQSYTNYNVKIIQLYDK